MIQLHLLIMRLDRLGQSHLASRLLEGAAWWEAEVSDGDHCNFQIGQLLQRYSGRMRYEKELIRFRDTTNGPKLIVHGKKIARIKRDYSVQR